MFQAVGLVLHYALRILSFIIIAQALLSFFMSPYHPVRQRIDMLVEPLLAPIRRMMPQTGMVDFSPMILLVIIWIADAIVVNLFR
jgi:YggT family protein